MGSIFADRIKVAAHELVVWNRTPAKARAVARGRGRGEPGRLGVAL
jgi:3-hydroxyisobutyrate dehydrogenase-like beta-hydroxyacid dehydrogenase